jgi:hypothetical protein
MAERNTTDRDFYLVAGLVLGLLVFAVAVLKASFAVGPQLLTSWAFPILKFLAFVGSGGLILTIGLGAPVYVFNTTVKYFQEHPRIRKEVTRHSPVMAAVGLLLAEFAVSSFDAASEGDRVVALGFKGLAVLGFWMANELFLNKKGLKFVGLALWLLTVSLLIAGTAAANRWSLARLWEEIIGMRSATIVSLSFVTVVLIVLPFVIRRRNPELFAEYR